MVQMRAGPFPLRMEERLIEVVPARRLVYRVRGWGHRQHEGLITLAPCGSATRLDWRVQLASRVPGTERWLRRMLERQFETDLEALCRRLALAS